MTPRDIALLFNRPGGVAPIVDPPPEFLPYWQIGQSVGNLDITHTEFSELSASVRDENVGFLWAIEDGNLPKFVAIHKATAALAGTWTLEGIAANDVESCASALIAGNPLLYLGDTGDNANAAATIKIHRVPEPVVTGANGNIAAGTIITATCAYPVGNVPTHKDVECILADPATGDVYIITKRITPVKMYRLPFLGAYPGTTNLEFSGNLTADATFNVISTTVSGNNGYVTGGSISPNGEEIVLRSYSALYYWKRETGETIVAALQRAPNRVLTHEYVGGGGGANNTASTNRKFFHPTGEPQGEAIAFDRDGVNLFTCSEFVSDQADVAGARRVNPLFRFNRLSEVPVVRSFQTGVSPTAGYAGCADTFVDQTTPAQTNGSAVSLVMDLDYSVFPAVSRARATFIKWDISEIPTDETVVAAYIDFWLNTEGKQFALYKILESWNAATANWDTGVIRDDAGGSGVPQVIYGTTQGVGVALDVYLGFVRVNLPLALVQEWVSNPASNFGLSGTGGPEEATGDGVQIDSSEGATAARRPKLTIVTAAGVLMLASQSNVIFQYTVGGFGQITWVNPGSVPNGTRIKLYRAGVIVDQRDNIAGEMEEDYSGLDTGGISYRVGVINLGDGVMTFDSVEVFSNSVVTF